MADDEATMTTTATATFRVNDLVRLCGLIVDTDLNGQLGRIESDSDEATGEFGVRVLDEQARPPAPAVPAASNTIEPDNMRHACEYCLRASAADGTESLQVCERCQTARYCNAECQRADWARHEEGDCARFSHDRGRNSLLRLACEQGDAAEVRRFVEEEGADVGETTIYGPTPLATAARGGHLSVVQYLVERGADKDKASAQGATPLFLAAQERKRRRTNTAGPPSSWRRFKITWQ